MRDVVEGQIGERHGGRSINGARLGRLVGRDLTNDVGQVAVVGEGKATSRVSYLVVAWPVEARLGERTHEACAAI